MPSIKSVSRKRMLARQVEVADTSWKRFLGIMGRKKMDRPLLFLLPSESISRATIHSLFCIPFDAIFLDAHQRVVDIKSNVRPGQFWIAPRSPALFLIEAPAGWAKKSGIALQEKLDLTL